ncbi:MAG: class I SAM-dependent methyltransferase [Candidatus Thermoplasmatota archaeon]
MFDRDYFETGNKRCAPPYTLENIYPRMLDIAKFFKSVYNPKKVLDIGCAKGFLVKAFSDLGVDAVGVDVSAYALTNSYLEVKHRLLCASAEKLPFHSKNFDFVFAVDLIEHLKDYKKFLLEANRILVEKGKLCIFTIGPRNPNASKDITHTALHSAKYWYKLFKEHGFNTTRLYYQVGYPHIKNAHYTISKKLKIQKLAQLYAIVKLNFKILWEQEYTFLLTKVREIV